MHTKVFVGIILISLLQGCEIKPEEIHYGEDQCAYCKMNIMDSKFGGEFVTTKGKIYKFDAVECMIPFQHEHDGAFKFILVTPYDQPGTLVDREEVTFIISDTIRSPMGAHLAALKAKPVLTATDETVSVLTWNELLEKLHHETH